MRFDGFNGRSGRRRELGKFRGALDGEKGRLKNAVANAIFELARRRVRRRARLAAAKEANGGENCESWNENFKGRAHSHICPINQMRELNRRDQEETGRPKGVQSGVDERSFATASEGAGGEKGGAEERGGQFERVERGDGEARGAAFRRFEIGRGEGASVRIDGVREDAPKFADAQNDRIKERSRRGADRFVGARGRPTILEQFGVGRTRFETGVGERGGVFDGSAEVKRFRIPKAPRGRRLNMAVNFRVVR